MMPAVIPLLLMMLPAMLTALAVVREKELGSIINLYVTPVTRTEFLLGKQLPYVALAMLNFLLMVLLAVTAFGVPMTGSFFASLGAKTLSFRQSSLPGTSSLVRPLISGCMQASPNSLASRVPVQPCAGCGGRQRNSPTGGAA